MVIHSGVLNHRPLCTFECSTFRFSVLFFSHHPLCCAYCTTLFVGNITCRTTLQPCCCSAPVVDPVAAGGSDSSRAWFKASYSANTEHAHKHTRACVFSCLQQLPVLTPAPAADNVDPPHALFAPRN